METDRRGDPLEAWRHGPRAIEAARAMAAVHGVIWFTLLSFGGQGLLFGPLAWLAAIAGAKFPAIAGGMLLIPVAYVLAGWVTLLTNGMDAGRWLILAALVVPAVSAASILIVVGMGRFVVRPAGPR